MRKVVLAATFPGELVHVESASRDRKAYIAFVLGATNPGGTSPDLDRRRRRQSGVHRRLVVWRLLGARRSGVLARALQMRRRGRARIRSVEMLEWVSKRVGRELRDDDYWTQVIGGRMADRERLIATSPARHADKFRAPLLLVHGRDDTVVPFAQSELMSDALKRANKPHQLLTIDGDDHWLSKSKTGVTFLGHLERFLGEHLK